MHKADIKIQDEKVMVIGDLNFLTVMPVWHASLRLLSSQSEFKFDFAKVNKCNSAGVALLLEWIKLAKQTAKTISFHNLPQQLRSIMDVAGLQGLIVNET